MDLSKISLNTTEKWECELTLSKWRTVLSELNKMDESTLIKLIYYEATTRQRTGILSRLYSRYNNIRKMKEQSELDAFMRLHNRMYGT